MRKNKARARIGSVPLTLARSVDVSARYVTDTCFRAGKALQPLWSNVEYLVYTNTSFLIVPDADEYTIWRRICQTLTADECARWRSCCQAAYECCERQLQEAHVYSPESCPRRWDGYGCWNAAPAGTTISMKCPTFIDHALPTSKIQLQI